jgi:hypothetical protein
MRYSKVLVYTRTGAGANTGANSGGALKSVSSVYSFLIVWRVRIANAARLPFALIDKTWIGCRNCCTYFLPQQCVRRINANFPNDLLKRIFIVAALMSQNVHDDALQKGR